MPSTALLPSDHDWVDRVAKLAPEAGPLRPRPAPFQRIVVAVDGSKGSEDAVAWVRELAGAKARIRLVTALGPDPELLRRFHEGGLRVPPSEFRKLEESNGQAILKEAKRLLGPLGKRADTRAVWGFPTIILPKEARGFKADLVVMGSHGHGAGERFMIGSVADQVRHHVSASVLLAKSAPGPGDVVVAVDGSKESRAATAIGLGLARRGGRQALIHHTFEPPVYFTEEDAKLEFKAILKTFQLPARPKGVRFVLSQGKAAVEIPAAAKAQKAALLVMGSRGRSGLKSLVMGSVSNRVAHHAPCSMLIVRA